MLCYTERTSLRKICYVNQLDCHSKAEYEIKEAAAARTSGGRRRKMKVIKRNGAEVPFDAEKIENAIRKANQSVSPAEALSPEQAHAISLQIQEACSALSTPPTVEDIQDRVVEAIMKAGAYKLANNYITYRYEHALLRKEMRKYRLPNPTTPEDLECRWSKLLTLPGRCSKKALFPRGSIVRLIQFSLRNISLFSAHYSRIYR